MCTTTLGEHGKREWDGDWCALLFRLCQDTYPAFMPYWHSSCHLTQTRSKLLTILLWALFVPIGCLGAGLSWWRAHYFSHVVVNKFRCELWAAIKTFGAE
jgi:hypothetical protein